MSEDEGQPTPPQYPAGDGGQQPPPQGPQFNPQSAYPQPPYSGQPPYQPYAAQQYGTQPGHPGMPQFPVYVLPDHPKATSALVVGIIAVAGTFLCGLPVLASPVAWVLGAQARREIRNAPQHWGGESKATAGMVLGIIGTVLLVLAILAITLIVVVAIASSGSSGSDTGV